MGLAGPWKWGNMHRNQSAVYLTILSVSFFTTPESAQGGDCSSGATPGTSAWSENLLINPSAETGDLTGWSAEPDFTVSSGSPGAFDGSVWIWSRSLRREGRLTVDDVWALTHCEKDNSAHVPKLV